LEIEYNLTVKQGDDIYTYKVEYNTPLYHVLLMQGFISTHDSCNGTGLCGKCLIKASGRLNKQTAEERSLVGDKLSRSGYRLACYCYVRGNCTVTLPPAEDGGMSQHEYGFSVDLGSSTIMVNLYDVKNQRLIQWLEQSNRQLAISLDIPGRIRAWKQSPESKNEMHSMLVDQLESMMLTILNEQSISPKRIKEIYVVGNTCMIHMLAGIDVSPLASPDSAPLTRDNLSVKAKNVGFQSLGHAHLNLMGSISGSIGSDAVSSALVVGVYKSQLPSLILNFGTNTEILLGNKNVLLAHSIGSTPALEGSGLSCVLSPASRPGVITNLYKDKYKICYHTVGDAPPIGISPVAAFEALEIMLDMGIIDKHGKMHDASTLRSSRLRMLGTVNGEQVFFVDRKHDIYITQQDIYTLIRLKATILCNVQLLLEEFDISSADEVAALYLTNIFGGMLNPQTAINIGIVPEIFEHCVYGIGDSVIRGASMLLCSPRARANAEHIRTYAHEIRIPPCEDYEKRLADAMELRRY